MGDCLWANKPSGYVNIRIRTMPKEPPNTQYPVLLDTADTSLIFAVCVLFVYCSLSGVYYSCYCLYKAIWDNRSRERLNGFSWNFYQTIPGKVEFATSCRRLANVDDLHNLRYDSGAITRGRHARRLRYKLMSVWMDLIWFELIFVIDMYFDADKVMRA